MKETGMIQRVDPSKMLAPVRPLAKGLLAGALMAGMVAVLLVVRPAAAASTQVRVERVLTHFDLARHQQPENLVLEPDGSVDVTFAAAGQVARVTPAGKTHVLATLPAPAAGSSAPIVGPIIGGNTFVGGIVRVADGTLYFNYSTGSANLTGIWRLSPGLHATPERVAALPATSLANGLALDEQTGFLYVADSALGNIWRVSIHGGTPTVWASGSALAPTSRLGANGIKVHHGAVWVSNLDAGTVLRIPVSHTGGAGGIETRATGLQGIDDFAFPGRRDMIVAAIITMNQLAIVNPDGTHPIVLTAADGLSNPTSVALSGNTIIVANSAYVTKTDPDLLLVHL